MEKLANTHAQATVKQHLAAVRMLFDWLVLGHSIESNPVAADRGRRHVVKTGKTPVLSAAEARGLLDSIDVSNVVGLRHRPLIAVMTFGFAPVSAAMAMRVEDYYTQGMRSYLRLHEKGGRFNQAPVHHLVRNTSTPTSKRRGSSRSRAQIESYDAALQPGAGRMSRLPR